MAGTSAMARVRVGGAALLLLSLLPAAATAQTDVSGEGRGWIGIQVEGRALPDGSARVMIVRVDNGGPAERAGVRPFDILLRLDGTDVSPEILSDLGDRLRPGTLVRLGVLRGGRERSVRVIAGRRPEPMGPAAMEELTARFDSARFQILHMMDSLLADTTWALARAEVERARRALDAEVQDARDLEATREVMARTREVMARTREVMARTREAMRSMRFRRPRPPVGPPPARGRITVGERRGPGGRPEGVRVTVGGAGFDERRGPGRRPPPPGVRFRSPYLLGERFVAGAELEEMEPDATAVSGVGAGRFQVVRVVEGSPADRAGLAPQDVIVGIGGQPVGDLMELRIRLGRLSRRGSPEIQVARGDTTLVITLSRPPRP